MKIAIFADIHGNLPALKAVLEDIKKENISKILVLGDILGGPFPIEVIRILRDLDAIMIRGNYEGYLLKIYSNPSNSHWYKSKQWSPTLWVYKRLNQYWLKFINSLPKQRIIPVDEKNDILMVHSIYDPMLPADDSGCLMTDKYDDVLPSYIRNIDQSVLLFAHNHVPYKKSFDGTLALSPGSIGIPLNGTIGAQYAIMHCENEIMRAEIRTVKYPIKDIQEGFLESGYLKEGGPIARLTLNCIKTGKAQMGLFFKFVKEIAFQKGYDEYEVIPDEILDLAEKKWDWDIFE